METMHLLPTGKLPSRQQVPWSLGRPFSKTSSILPGMEGQVTRCRTLFLPHHRLDLGPTGTCSSCSTCFTLAGEHFGLWAFQRTDQGWPMGLVLVAEAEVGCLLTAKSWLDRLSPRTSLVTRL